MVQCRRCLLTTNIKSVLIDESGICNFCKLHDKLEVAYPITGTEKLFEKIKHETKKDEFSCVIGISGGCDSSYMIWKAVDAGLNPLAVHFDNSWNSPIAEHNIRIMTDNLGVRLVRYEATESYHKLNKAFFAASVSDADVPNDIGILTKILETADKYGIKYNFSGHNFRTEGTTPVCWTMMDSQYIQDVYEWYYKEPLKDFPLMSLAKQVYWGMKGIKTVRPLYSLDYDKAAAKTELIREFDWLDYGGVHCENIFTAFVGSVLLPQKFRIDKRQIYLSACVRSGLMSMDHAKSSLRDMPTYPDNYKQMVIARYFDSSDENFQQMMLEAPKSFMDYGDYFSKFRKYKWLYWLGMKSGVFAKTYYEKYTTEAKNWKKPRT